MAFRWLLAGLLALAACSEQPQADLSAHAARREVALPDGTRVNAEVMMRADDRARGMMFRDALLAGEGMLFVHPEPGRYGYWMHNVRIPLDIIWMDAERRIVEISAGTPPCLKEASQCPSYGGQHEAMFVLELGGGEAARHGLKPGDRIGF